MRTNRLIGFFAISLLLEVGCRPQRPSVSEPPLPDHYRKLTVLYTNDEHGWLEPFKAKDGSLHGGAAEIMARWRDLHGYDPSDSSFLLLSGGDNWTGPAISTMHQGESTFEAMQAMGYDASAVGNHEFDFGVALLRERMQEATFPYLSANIVEKGTHRTAEGFTPYTILHAGEVKIGVIGLTTIYTPTTTFPTNVADFEFLPYEQSLTRWVPVVKKAGADLIVAIGHVCVDELAALAPIARQLGVTLLTGGHCNELESKVVDGVQIIEGGSYWRSYACLEIIFDVQADSVVSMKNQLVADLNTDWSHPRKDSSIAAIVAKWHLRTAEQMEVVIGYTANGIALDWPLYNLITDSWRVKFPEADIAYTNSGGVRDAIDAGPITIGDIFAVLPFDNEIVGVKVTGEQVLENVNCCGGIFSGMSSKDGEWVHPDGTPLKLDSTYNVLINDFMYAGGSRYIFGEQDSNAYVTGVNFRQPVIDYLKSLNTSKSNPLEKLLTDEIRSSRH